MLYDLISTAEDFLADNSYSDLQSNEHCDVDHNHSQSKSSISIPVEKLTALGFDHNGDEHIHNFDRHDGDNQRNSPANLPNDCQLQ